MLDYDEMTCILGKYGLNMLRMEKGEPWRIPTMWQEDGYPYPVLDNTLFTMEISAPGLMALCKDLKKLKDPLEELKDACSNWMSNVDPWGDVEMPDEFKIPPIEGRYKIKHKEKL